jgi:hypothetical protein
MIEVVDGDKEDVGFFGGGDVSERCGESDEEEKQAQAFGEIAQSHAS